MSDAAKRSSMMKTEEREAALAVWSSSVTARRVSFALKPDWWGSRTLL